MSEALTASEGFEGDVSKRLALLGAAALLISFLCPLVVGPSALFFTDWSKIPIPAARIVGFAPLVLALLGGALALSTRGLGRAAGLLLAVGLTNAVAIGAMEVTLEGLAQHEPTPALTLLTAASKDASWAGFLLLGLELGLTLGFVGLTLTLHRPDHALGSQLGGFAGLLVLVVVVAPPGPGKDPMIAALFGDLWGDFWPAPVSVAALLAFGLCLVSLFFHAYDHQDLARLARLLGLAALLVLPAGLALKAFDAGPVVWATVLTLLLKTYGTFIAMHVLAAAGLLGLLVDGFLPPPPPAEA